jgi:hypothetical protein
MMELSQSDDSLAEAAAALPAEHTELLALLHEFTARRLASADAARLEAVRTASAAGEEEPFGRALHAFLREGWEALDGLGREVNLCMHHLFPDAGLYPPGEMTRQCTFYVVRRKLHEAPAVADHPVSRLLWERTRERPDLPYERLSFLYNLGLFLPLRLTEDGRLPGCGDVLPSARRIVRAAHVPPCPVAEGLEEIVVWLGSFAAECCALLARALSQQPRQRH